jgi:hypothetical protein
MEREGYKGNSSDADGEQNEFGQGPGSQDCAVDQGLSQEENRFQHQGIWRVAGGAAIRKQHHPAPLLFDASHPAIELPSEQTITGTDYQQSQSLG